MKRDALTNKPATMPIAKTPVLPPKAEEPKGAVARDEANFSYVTANKPQGAEVPLRIMQEVVGNADDIGHTALTEVARGGEWLKQSVVARILGWLPQQVSGALDAASESKPIALLSRVTKLPFYGAFANVVTKVSPVIGLVMAPFDIKNCVNLWKDKKALLPHKILTTVRTVTGTAMCLGGMLSFVLPWMGFPGAGAMALNLALKVGLVNLFASLPYWATGIGGAIAGVGKAIGGAFKKVFSAL